MAYDNESLTGTPTWTQGAMSVYPGWVDPLLGDFRLKSISPLINQGVGRITNYSMPSCDFDGMARLSGDSPVDIGAYEVPMLFYDVYKDGTTNAWSAVNP